MILKLFSVTCLAAACDYPVCINYAHTTPYKNYVRTFHLYNSISPLTLV